MYSFLVAMNSSAVSINVWSRMLQTDINVLLHLAAVPVPYKCLSNSLRNQKAKGF